MGRTSTNGLKLRKKNIRLNSRKCFIMVRSGRQWGNLPGEVRGLPITEMLEDGPRSHKTGFAETVVSQASRTGGWCVSPPKFELIPQRNGAFWEEIQGFSQAFSLSPTQEQGAGGICHIPFPLELQRSTPAVPLPKGKRAAAPRGGIIWTWKEGRSLLAEPSQQQTER